MNQFSKAADAILHKLSRKITIAEAQIDASTKEKDLAWDEVNNLFNEFGRVGQEARFISDNGYTLHRTVRPSAPKLNEEQLEERLITQYGKKDGTRLWHAITDRKVNSTMLEQLVQRGQIDASLVNDCLTPGKDSFPRLHPKWTKEDEEKAIIFGLERK
jgi:hypothetical protein